ncbi:asparaginase [Priestia koreensis]|uniref:asparaginase n=1 Tax=Priestia koreensis TaxID=284581 RepID=UPI00203B94B2|nr:asparaginase [Priestia koreensis]MCM3003941.1 asparaginase [Priestia koreensis]
MKTVLILHTGGTISMKEDTTGAVKPDGRNPLADTAPSLKNLATIISEEIFYLPSPHMTPKDMLIISNRIKEKIDEDNSIDGVVITHGTDTLEETAYFLDLTLDIDVPVVLTGAMRSSNEIGSDGLYNLISAIRVATSEKARQKGVLVVMNDEIHTAKNVTKTHTSNVATFQSPQYGPIGMVTKTDVTFHHTPNHLDVYSISDVSQNVLLLKAYAGMDEQIFNAIQTIPIDGLVIEALGQGNLPPTTVPAITHLIQKGIPIVLVSRCFNGIAQDVYGYEGGGKQLKDLGVIFSNGLNGQKARLKLLVALETTHDHDKLQYLFNQ